MDRFTNGYFTALLQWNNRQVKLGDVASIPTDVALVVDDNLRRYVELYAQNQDVYFRVFKRAFQKLVDSTATSRQRY
jgi:catalase (peroxidase I)